jgi:hypothetical protein
MSLEQTVGELKGTVTALQDDVTEIKSDVKTLVARENFRRGGFAVLSVIFGLVGGLIAKVLAS